MSRKKNFIYGALAINFKNFAIGLLSIVFTPILLNKIGADGYGIWILIGNIIGYVNLFDLGITGSSNTLIARVKNNTEVLKPLISNILFLQTIIGVLILLVGFVFSFFISSFFNITTTINPSVESVFLLSIFSFALTFPIRTYVSVLVGNQLIHNNAFIELSVHIISIGIQLLFLYLDFGLISLPIGLLSTRFLLFYVYYLHLKKKLPNLSVSFKYVSFTEMKTIFNVSLMWFIGSIAAVLIYASDNILIGKFMGTDAIAKYSLTLLLVEFIRQRIYSVNAALMPGIGELFGNGEFEKVKNLYLKTQKSVWIFAIISAQFVFLFNEFFVKFWVGEKYFVGDNVNLLFSIYLFLTIIFHSSAIIISSSLQIKSISLFRFFEAILNISLSIYFVNKYGYIGLIGSTVFALISTNFWFAAYKTMSILNITKLYYFKEILLKVAPYLLFFLVFDFFVLCLFKSFFEILIVRAFIFAVLSLITIYRVEKELILNIVKKIKKQT